MPEWLRPRTELNWVTDPPSRNSCGQGEISKIERGVTNQTVDTIVRIAAPLDAHFALIDSTGRPVAETPTA
ncbi:MAG: hypothetical protein ACYCO3_04325 [Mycobacteriales bacterium]